LHRRAVTIPTGLLGIGVLGVGIFPGNIHPRHPIFAYTAFLAGGLAVLLSYRVSPQPLRVIFAILGAVSLLFTVAGVFLPEWGPFARLELAGWSGGWSTRLCCGLRHGRRGARAHAQGCGAPHAGCGPARGRRHSDKLPAASEQVRQTAMVRAWAKRR
jgi:hypothetical protein